MFLTQRSNPHLLHWQVDSLLPARKPTQVHTVMQNKWYHKQSCPCGELTEAKSSLWLKVARGDPADQSLGWPSKFMLTQRHAGLCVRKAGLSPATIPYAGMDGLHTLPLIQPSEQHHGIDTSDPIFRWANRGSKRLPDQPKVTWLIPRRNCTTKKSCGLPRCLMGKESTCQCRRYRLDPWVRKIPWEGNRNPL